MKATVKVYYRFQHDWDKYQMSEIENYLAENLQYIKQNDFLEIQNKHTILKVEKIIHKIGPRPVVEFYLGLR